MRADRLLSLLLLLQARGRMTAQELAEQLEVSERTIYRDIDALSSAGIPIYTERGPGGGYELVDGYQTKLTGLTGMEVRALFLLSASSPLADLGLGQALEDALLKLSAALPAASRTDALQVRQRIHLDTILRQHSRQAPPHLGLIQEAVWQDRRLRLTYSNSHRRYFDPYGLVLHASAWYLVGVATGAMQVTRISQIQAAEMTEQHFTRCPEFDLAIFWAEHRAHHVSIQQSAKRATVPPASATGSARPQRKKTKLRTGLHIGRKNRAPLSAIPRNKKKDFVFASLTPRHHATVA